MPSSRIKECIEKVSSAEDIPEAFRHFEKDLCEGAVRGLDITHLGGLDEWVRWLGWSSVVLNEDDYLIAAVHALRLAPKFAATDYGTSRQRDLGQLWSDAIRGLLGEIAFAKWLRERYGRLVELDYRRGSLEEFLPSDIKHIDGRPPRLNVSIKTTKLSGVWLDIPGAQVEHSDVFVLVRVGVAREHLLAFLKKISVIRDKLFAVAQMRGLLGAEELDEIWNAVSDFSPLPAYVAGFLEKSEVATRAPRRCAIIEADGEVKKRRVVINKYLGYWNPKERLIYEQHLKELLEKRGKNVGRDMPVVFEGIGGFSGGLHFIASSGLLRKRKEEWDELVRRL